MTVRIKGTFRKDAAEYNGLDDGGPVYKGLQTEPLNRIPVIGYIEVARSGKNYEKGGIDEVTIRFISIEAVTNNDDALIVREIHDKRFKERTGRTDVQQSLFDREDPQANEDAQRMGEILQGQLPAGLMSEAPPEGEDPPPDEGGEGGKRRRRGGAS